MNILVCAAVDVEGLLGKSQQDCDNEGSWSGWGDWRRAALRRLFSFFVGPWAVCLSCSSTAIRGWPGAVELLLDGGSEAVALLPENSG